MPVQFLNRRLRLLRRIALQNILQPLTHVFAPSGLRLRWIANNLKEADIWAATLNGSFVRIIGLMYQTDSVAQIS